MSKRKPRPLVLVSAATVTTSVIALNTFFIAGISDQLDVAFRKVVFSLALIDKPGQTHPAPHALPFAF